MSKQPSKYTFVSNIDLISRPILKLEECIQFHLMQTNQIPQNLHTQPSNTQPTYFFYDKISFILDLDTGSPLNKDDLYSCIKLCKQQTYLEQSRYNVENDTATQNGDLLGEANSRLSGGGAGLGDNNPQYDQLGLGLNNENDPGRNFFIYIEKYEKDGNLSNPTGGLIKNNFPMEMSNFSTFSNIDMSNMSNLNKKTTEIYNILVNLSSSLEKEFYPVLTWRQNNHEMDSIVENTNTENCQHTLRGDRF